MKKSILALSAFAAILAVSCTGQSDNNQQQDQLVDTIVQAQVEEALEVTGVAVDGAMNSVYLKVGEDTIEFSYPDLDSEHRASWAINDTLTVRYFETEEGDSVTAVINESDA